MTSCSLFASGLVPDVNGAVPTFSYRPNDHQGDFFGVQMTYLRGTSTCYQTGALPQFTPVIQNEAAKFNVECRFSTQGSTYTGIFCPDAPVTNVPNGVLTVSYINCARGQPTPIPFYATFGPSPVPKTVTATASVTSTSTSTSTATAPAGYASTTTLYSAGTTKTETSTITVTQTRTSTNTNYLSSCSSTPSSSTTSTIPIPTGFSNSCPADHGKLVYTSAGTFQVVCSYDRDGVTTGLFHPGNGLLGCIDLCANTKGCVWSTYYEKNPDDACYLKFGQGTPNQNPAAWGATLVTSSSSSSLSSSTSDVSRSSTSSQVISSSSSPPSSASTTSAASSTATATGISCPGDNDKTVNTGAGAFIVECYKDRGGGDIGTQYPDGGFNGCIQLCANTPTCVDVSYSPNGPCYLKNLLNTPKSDKSIWGARLASAASYTASTAGSTVSSTTAALSSTATTPSITTTGTVLPVQTVTVTTTISSTNYQCVCTPSGLSSGSLPATASATQGATLDCPSSDGKTYTSDCGATYMIECYSDRFGEDIPGGSSKMSSLNDCIADCDSTNGCVDVSYIPGSPGICYKKKSIAEIRQNNNVFGARQLTGCKANTKLKLHRKRVVREPKLQNRHPQERGFYGPDYTFTQSSTTVTKTTTSTYVQYTTTTVTPANVGTSTKIVSTTSTSTATITSGATLTQISQITITTCPAVTKRAVL